MICGRKTYLFPLNEDEHTRPSTLSDINLASKIEQKWAYKLVSWVGAPFTVTHSHTSDLPVGSLIASTYYTGNEELFSKMV